MGELWWEIPPVSNFRFARLNSFRVQRFLTSTACGGVADFKDHGGMDRGDCFHGLFPASARNVFRTRSEVRKPASWTKRPIPDFSERISPSRFALNSTPRVPVILMFRLRAMARPEDSSMMRSSAGHYSGMAMAFDSPATRWEEFTAKPQRSRRDAKIGGVRPVPSNRHWRVVIMARSQTDFLDQGRGCV